jgi:hypothetical protein
MRRLLTMNATRIGYATLTPGYFAPVDEKNGNVGSDENLGEASV